MINTITTKKAKRLDSRQRTKGHTERAADEAKHGKQLIKATTREQRKRDKEIKLSEEYKGGGSDAEDILSVVTVNNEVGNKDYGEDSSNDASETDSYCRHCLRPQSELQFKYMRPRQRSKLRQQQQAKRERSKQRFSSYCVGSGSGNANMSSNNGNQAQKARSKKSRSKSRAKRARNNKHPTYSCSNNNRESHLKLPLIRDLNMANEQAIRFRCPQVGPQVGRDRQMPPMLHFHHPQHLQKQPTAYQLQYTNIYVQQQQLQQQQRFCGQQAVSPMQTTTLTMESELQQQQTHLHHHHHHCCHQNTEHLSNNQKSNKNQQQQQQHVTAINNNSQNCCSPNYQQNQQTTRHQCPQCTTDYQQQANCCNAGTTTATTTSCCYSCCCPKTATATTTQLYHHQYPHNNAVLQQQHHNLPQLPPTHLETSSVTAVAALDATTLVVTATKTCTNAPPPSQVLAPSSLPLTAEQRNLNLNNPPTTEEDPSNLAAATTPDSPSLVKVSTWYTVAKQGVSC